MWFNGVVKQSDVMQDAVSVTFRHSTVRSWCGYGNQFVKINLKDATVHSRKHRQPSLLYLVHTESLFSNKILATAADHFDLGKTTGRK
jgi:hypothetical protein